MQSRKLDYFLSRLYSDVVPKRNGSLDFAIDVLNDVIDKYSLDFFGEHKSKFEISLRKSNMWGYDYNLIRFTHKSMYDFYIEFGYKEYREGKISELLPAIVIFDNLVYHLDRFKDTKESRKKLQDAVKSVESELNKILWNRVYETNLKLQDMQAHFVYKLYKVESRLE